MFWKRKPKPPPPPADPELAAAQAALAQQREKVAALELDLFNSRLELAQFNAELERRLGALQQRLEALEVELAEARRVSARRTLWGERAASPDLPDDAVAQHNSAWGRGAQTPPAAPPPPTEPDPQQEAELKQLYRTLAKRFHPDLAANAADREGRAARMAEVNAAYAAQDLAQLRRLAQAPDYAAAGPATPKTRTELLAELRAETGRLAALAASLEAELNHLAGTPAVQLKLEALFARRAGRDLIAEMAADLATEVRRAEAELAALR
ncbi:MAG: hypothetical protein IT318_00610 [Anaerolineales bacterium]|nr:hypothetical protein [Anaerolineales bacterium]